jgi:hypothetical protein
LGKRGGHFAAASSNGIFVHTCDLRYETIATVSEALGFERDVPAALLLIEAT